jgi:hypothetical protein
VKDLDSSELKDLEFALERPAADLSEAKFAATEPLGQFVGVTGPQRLQGHERLRLPRALVAILQFSDLYCTHAPNTLEAFEEKELAGQLPGTRLRRRARR